MGGNAYTKEPNENGQESDETPDEPTPADEPITTVETDNNKPEGA